MAKPVCHTEQIQFRRAVILSINCPSYELQHTGYLIPIKFLFIILTLRHIAAFWSFRLSLRGTRTSKLLAYGDSLVGVG